MPAKRKPQHVIPHPKGWAVQREGSREVASVFPTKREAIDAALRHSQRNGDDRDVVIHGRAGQAFLRARVQGDIEESTIRQAVRRLQDRSNRKAGAPLQKYPD